MLQAANCASSRGTHPAATGPGGPVRTAQHHHAGGPGGGDRTLSFRQELPVESVAWSWLWYVPLRTSLPSCAPAFFAKPIHLTCLPGLAQQHAECPPSLSANGLRWGSHLTETPFHQGAKQTGWLAAPLACLVIMQLLAVCCAVPSRAEEVLLWAEVHGQLKALTDLCHKPRAPSQDSPGQSSFRDLTAYQLGEDVKQLIDRRHVLGQGFWSFLADVWFWLPKWALTNCLSP